MKFALPLVVAVAAFTGAPGAMAAAQLGETQNCIRLSDIEDSPAIDDKTILVKMTGGKAFRRIDLRTSCPGLTLSGFSHRTPQAQLCRSDILNVNQPVGATCAIEKIVTIDAAEARALEARR